MSSENRPTSVFRYEAFNAQSLLNLKEQVIYFSNPNSFNDVYDCRIEARFKPITDDAALELKKYWATQKGTSKEHRKTFRKQPIEELKEMAHRVAEDIINDSKKRFAAEHGVACFSAANDNLLMWAHYGGRSKGFCLEFRTDRDPLSKVRQVHYTDSMPLIDVTAFLNKSNMEQVFDLYTTKSTAWKYENEWRSFHRQSGTKYVYPPEALKAVYFGPEMERAAIEIVCLILQGQNQQVNFYSGRRNMDKFAVQFDKFDYIPYVNVPTGDI